MSKIILFFKKNRNLLILYSIVTIFFIIQHISHLSWDFVSYLLNAKYLFLDGNYFEWYRPPLAPVLLGVLGFFSVVKADYLYIVLVSTLHLYSCIAVSKKLDLNPLYYYAVSISPFLLGYGLLIGTELLTLSLIQLAIAYLDYCGIFIALAFLSRYPSIILSPIILFLRDYKKIIKNILFFSLIVGLWLFFNYTKTGNFFTSILDFYLINLKLRTYIFSSFNLLSILVVGTYLIPLALLGVINRFRKFESTDYIMLLIAVLVLINYITIPLKVSRYLFLILIPLVYFSVQFIHKIKFRKYIIYSIVLLNVLFMFIVLVLAREDLSVYEEAISNLPDGCLVASNAWPYLNYLGVNATYLKKIELLDYTINEGYRLVIFYDIKAIVREPFYINDEEFLMQFPIIYQNEDYIILGDKNKCKTEFDLNKPYIENLKNDILNIYGYEVDTSIFNILFGPEY